MPRAYERSTQPQDFEGREVAVRNDGVHVRLPLPKMEFDRDPESDAHEDLRQLTNLAQQFVNQYGFEDPAKLNELREQACQLMESDEIDPNVPFEDSNAPENLTIGEVLPLLSRISQQLMVVMDNVLEISRSQIKQWLTMCCSVVSDHERGCIEVALKLKQHHYIAFLEAFLAGKIYAAAMNIIMDNTLDGLKEFAYQGSSHSSSALQTIGLLQQMLQEQDIEVVCPLLDLQNELFPTTIHLRIQVSDPEQLKKEVFAPEAISQWVSITPRNEVKSLLQDIFSLGEISEPGKVVAEVKPFNIQPMTKLTEAQQQWSVEGEKTKGVIAKFLQDRLVHVGIEDEVDLGSEKTLPSTSEKDITKIAASLSVIADDIDERYGNKFQEMKNALFKGTQPTNSILYDSFRKICREIFLQGISWGKIVVLLEFAVYLVKDAASGGALKKLLRRLIGFLIQFIFYEVIASATKSIFSWIMEQGGWSAVTERNIGKLVGDFVVADADTMYSFLKYSLLAVTGIFALKVILRQ